MLAASPATSTIHGLVLQVRGAQARRAEVVLELAPHRTTCAVVGEWPWNPLALRPHSTSLRVRARRGPRARARPRHGGGRVCLVRVLRCSTPDDEMARRSRLLDTGLPPALAGSLPGSREVRELRRAAPPALIEAADAVASAQDPRFSWTWQDRLLSAAWRAAARACRDEPWSLWRDYGTHPGACLPHRACLALHRAAGHRAEPEGVKCIRALAARCAALKSTGARLLERERRRCDRAAAGVPGIRSDAVVALRCGARSPRPLHRLEREVEALCHRLRREGRLLLGGRPADGAARVCPTVPSAHTHRATTVDRFTPPAPAAPPGEIAVMDAHLLGLEQAATLLAAAPRGWAVRLVGDPCQLPPLGTGALLRNLLGPGAGAGAGAAVPSGGAEVVDLPAGTPIDRWCRQHRRAGETFLCASSHWCRLLHPGDPEEDRVICTRNMGDLYNGMIGVRTHGGRSLTLRCGAVHAVTDPAALLPGWAVTVRRLQGGRISGPVLVVATPDMSRRTLHTALACCAEPASCRVLRTCPWDELLDRDTAEHENASWVAPLPPPTAPPPPPPPAPPTGEP